MFRHTHFDVDIVRRVDPERLRWPEARQARDDSGFGGNREYCDLRGLTWSDVAEVLDQESELILRIETSLDPEDELELIADELAEDPGSMMGLDLGVATTAAALSAAGCVPFASCNGGAYGGLHHETYPLVMFCARRQAVPHLLAAAERAGVGLESDPSGEVCVYADDIRRMRLFAVELFDDHRRFLNPAGVG
jgi:hypothetical protein